METAVPCRTASRSRSSSAPPVPGVARPHRRRGVLGLVRGSPPGGIPDREADLGPDHPPRLRVPDDDRLHRANPASVALLLSLASARRGAGSRLLQRTDHPGRVPPGGGARGDLAEGHRIRVRRIPAARRAKAFESNAGGWAIQLQNLERHVLVTSRAPRRPSRPPLFAALGDPMRMHLLERLSADGPLSITALTQGTKVTRQAVTKHLRRWPVPGWCGAGRRAASGSGSSGPTSSTRRGAPG